MQVFLRVLQPRFREQQPVEAFRDLVGQIQPHQIHIGARLVGLFRGDSRPGAAARGPLDRLADPEVRLVRAAEAERLRLEVGIVADHRLRQGPGLLDARARRLVLVPRRGDEGVGVEREGETLLESPRGRVVRAGGRRHDGRRDHEKDTPRDVRHRETTREVSHDVPPPLTP